MFKLYSRLAIQNIRNDKKRFLPFLLTMSLLTVMLYNFMSMMRNPYILSAHGGRSIQQVLSFGSLVTGIAIIIISFYAYSFVLKGRQEEFSLLNTLGLEKKHIRSMVLIELIMLYLGTVLLGITVGILVDKLIFATLTVFLDGRVQYGFFISLDAVLWTTLIVLALYVGFFIRTGFQIQMNSISGLRQLSSQGEKEPKAKVWLALIGMIFLAIGYYQALTITNPLKAIMNFAIAVGSVIIGTYCVITAGSITYLKWRKKRKKVYYQPEHFINTSNLLYRMKANAVGLGNIAILSTMVIIMLAMSISLAVGIKKTIDQQYPRDYEISVLHTNQEKNVSDGYYFKAITDKEVDGYWKAITSLNKKYHIQPTDISYFRSLGISGLLKNGEFSFEQINSETPMNTSTLVQVTFLVQSDLNHSFHTKLNLKKGELAIYDPENILQGKDINFFGTKKKYRTISNLNTYLIGNHDMDIYKKLYVVVDSLKSLEHVNVLQSNKNGQENSIPLSIKYNGQSIHDQNYIDELVQVLSKESQKNSSNLKTSFIVNSKRISYRDLLSFYVGVIYVLGMLSVLFTSVSVLVIYYKQVSEGTKDRDNYLIMQKVGMDDDMIHKTIRQQIKIIFFLPPLIAIAHVLGAMKYMHLVMSVIVTIPQMTFIWITLASLGAYLIFFYIVYTLTTRTYYEIVKS